MQLDCGIRCQRIVDWLDVELALPRQGEAWAFSHGDGVCHVRAEDLGARTVGGITLERTLLQAEGDEAALKEFNRRFTLRFISAGG